MQLISCPNKAFFTDLTFDLYLKMYLLTSDLNFTEQKNEALCMKFTYHYVYVILNSWFLTKLNQMQLVSGTCKTCSCILTVDLDLWMDSLTLDIIFEMENMNCALMKFTEKVCLIIKSGF